MITRSFAVVTICCCILIVFQTIMSTTSARKSTGIDELMIRDQKIRKGQNRYIEETAFDNELFENINDPVQSYNSKSSEQDEASHPLPSFIVDYANMIRNDFILFDNSIETRTRKRGSRNIIVEKRNQAMPDIACNCEISNETKDLGTNTYPRFIENRTCSQNKCQRSYICKPTIYNLTLLRKRGGLSMKPSSALESVEVPSDIRRRWFAEESPVITGCVCEKEYIIPKK